MAFLRFCINATVWLFRMTWRACAWTYQQLRTHAWPWYKGQTRRTQIIVGSITGILLISCCAFGALNSNASTTDTTSQQANDGGSSTSPGVIVTSATDTPQAQSPTATHTAVDATPKPGSTPAPVATQPVSHPPTATPKPAPKYPAINGNPYDYTFTNTGHLAYSPPADICNWFNCIASFWNGTGFMNECVDGTYSLSGGHQGDCSKHGNELRPVYKP